MILLFATIITLIAAAHGEKDIAHHFKVSNLTDINVKIKEHNYNITVTNPISERHFQSKKINGLCETPTCVHEAAWILDNMDPNVNPCDNFYQFACGKFGNKDSIFKEVHTKIDQQLQLIIADKIKEDDIHAFKLLKTYYKTCIDTDDSIKMGEIIKEELRDDFKKSGGCPVLEGPSWDEANFDWKRSMYESNKMGYPINYFTEIDIIPDPADSNKHILAIFPAKTVIPHENLVNGKNDTMFEYVSKIFGEILEVFEVNKTESKNAIDSVADFQIDLAKISLSPDKFEDPKLLKNRMTLQQLETKYPGIPWIEYINEIIKPSGHIEQSEEIIVADPSFLERLPALISKTPKRVLANYVCIHRVDDMIDYMGKELLNILYKNRATLGVELEPRKEICFHMLLQHFRPAISRLYVKHYFDMSDKAKVARLSTNVQKSIRYMFNQARWIDRITKRNALKKLKAMELIVGNPDELDDDEKINEYYQNVTLHSQSLLRSEMALNKLKREQQFLRLRKLGNENRWLSYSDVISADATYDLMKNRLVLSAAILQGHFYNSDRPNYMNYGIIGSLIGSQMSEGFNDDGRQFDENGNLNNWWGPGIKKEYLKKAKCFVKQYNNYTVKEVNMTINGSRTRNKNIADNMGLQAAYLGYNKWSKNHREEPRLPGLCYTPRQMFWISFANMHCKKTNPKALKRMIEHGTRAPEEFGVIGTLSNIPEFSKDFNCPLKSPMNPVKKCSIW